MNGSVSRELILGAYISYGTGHHAAAWRHHDASADAAQDVDAYLELARSAERGLFDFMFLSDTPSVFRDDRDGFGSRVVVFEPMTLLSAIATHTCHLGLVATGSTTYKEPYNLAREFASLDHISKGRAGWNVVTSSKPDAAANFGLAAHPAHDTRYARAEEFVDVVCGLWDSWEDDALPRDKESGVFYDPDKVHELRHAGAHFSIRGPLNISRPPQGHPVIVQAGGSELGKGLGARFAELVFTASPDIDSAKSFYGDVKSRLVSRGRARDSLRILPGLSPYVGRTDEEAAARFQQLQGLIPPRLGVSMLSDLVGGFDLHGHDVDGPLPDLPPSNANTTKRTIIERMARDEGLTIRQLYERVVVSRGHLCVVGSYRTVAETMKTWLDEEAADGFNIMPPYLPGALDDFVDHVVPELQRLGAYKTHYRPGTLRDKLGLDRPINRFTVNRRSAQPATVAFS